MNRTALRTLQSLLPRKSLKLPSLALHPWCNNMRRGVCVNVAASGTRSSLSARTGAAQKSMQGENNAGFRLVTWNVDGLGEATVEERAVGACNSLRRLRPDVIMLQEIVPENHGIFKGRLEAAGYTWHDGGAGELFSYHVAIALRRQVMQIVDCQLRVFEGTHMERHLLKCQAKFGDMPAVLLTAHLESLKDSSEIRKRQFSEVLRELSSSEAPICLFGGDTNLRSREAADVLKLHGQAMDACARDTHRRHILDAWEAAGAQLEHQWTWEPLQNINIGFRSPVKCRFDRVYFSTTAPSQPVESSSCPGLQSVSFHLTGKSLLPGLGLHPSDHWGICCDFVLPHAQ